MFERQLSKLLLSRKRQRSAPHHRTCGSMGLPVPSPSPFDHRTTTTHNPKALVNPLSPSPSALKQGYHFEMEEKHQDPAQPMCCFKQFKPALPLPFSHSRSRSLSSSSSLSSTSSVTTHSHTHTNAHSAEIPLDGDANSVTEPTDASPAASQKHISFSQDTKAWDGPRAIHGDFDELLFCFLIKGKAIGDGDVLKWTQSDASRVLSLCTLLSDLVTRLRESPDKQPVPCLPHGGGRALRIEKCYEPYLVTLLTVLVTALKQATKNKEKVEEGVVEELLQVAKKGKEREKEKQVDLA